MYNQYILIKDFSEAWPVVETAAEHARREYLGHHLASQELPVICEGILCVHRLPAREGYVGYVPLVSYNSLLRKFFPVSGRIADVLEKFILYPYKL